ncbi:DUF6116 family protein [Cognatilysobacter segetis]|uniref:DUF6116 family protein n=1 Tax=Cognatilysobacter segetis TaxID=2492394 RepID=UPI00105CA47A|nr:DUF6116 family protein [Lysobacter segetis]
MTRYLIKPFMRWAEKLQHPTLFRITALLFVVDMLVPDIVPFADEILLGLATMLFANWKRRKELPPVSSRR